MAVSSKEQRESILFIINGRTFRAGIMSYQHLRCFRVERRRKGAMAELVERGLWKQSVVAVGDTRAPSRLFPHAEGR